MRTHEWVDQRSLALDQEIARLLRANPRLLARARATLDRWIESREPCVPPVLLEWKKILERSSFEEIIEWLLRSDEEARRLRQSSSFCGILSSEARLAILKEYESQRA